MKPRVLVNALSMSEGGGRSYVTNLLRELARDDRGIAFTFVAADGQLDDLDTSGVDVRVIRLPSKPRAARVPLRVLYEESGLPWLARKFDLLYCIADICPAIGTTPTVVLLRNLNIYDRSYYDNPRTRGLARLAGLGVKRATRVLFPSRAAADLIRQHLEVPEDRVSVVHYGIDLEAFESGPAIESEQPYLFLPAALEKHKNIPTVIQALARCSDNRLQLWLAGSSVHDPQHRDELSALAEAAGVGDRVVTLGAVPYTQLLRYYRGARALVFPSFIETFGHPVLEAMAAETPLVLSDIPTFREIGGEAALYFPPADATALARCIDAVTQSPEATASRVALGRERVQHFSWRASVDALCRELHRAIAE